MELGIWYQVGTVKLPGYPDTSKPDGYDLNGVKNPDGSASTSLLFSQRETFDGGVQLAVNLSGLGMSSNQQGPTDVRFDSGVCFAQWAYPATAGYYDYTCRQMAGNPSRMICAMTVHLSNPDPNSIWTAYNGRVVYYSAFSR